MNILKLAIFGLGLIALPVSGLAQPGGGRPNQKHFRSNPNGQMGRRPMHQDQRKKMQEKLLEELNLSSSQKNALKKFRKDREALKEIGLDIQDKRTEMSLLLKNEKASESDIRSNLKELNKLMVKMNEQRVQNLLNLRKALDGTQFKKVMRFFEALQKKRGKGGQQGERRGPGSGGHGRQ